MTLAFNRLRRFSLVGELMLVIVACVLATLPWLDPNPDLKVPGSEGEWLTSSDQFAANGVRAYGYIPLWQPYLDHGEPLIDNPFSMALNPVNLLPSILFGAKAGLRYAVVLSTVLAGLGGWFLARTLGLGILARVVLGLLIAGRGNMMGMIGLGYYQLGVSQAYMPWIIAGALRILRGQQRRTAIVLTAVMLTLMFFAGNIYFLLPTLLSVFALTLTHLFRPRFNRDGLIGLGAAALLTLGLSAVSFLPIFLQRQYIGGHPNDLGMGPNTDLGLVVARFFDPSYAVYAEHRLPYGPEMYQSYVLPLWFALLVFLIPPLLSLRRRVRTARDWSVSGVAVILVMFFTLWGAGHNPVVSWLLHRIPFLGQWRFVGRMLAVASLWLAILAAMRLDGLWRALIVERAWHGRQMRRIMAALVTALSLIAAAHVLAQWRTYALPDSRGPSLEDFCTTWLRLSYPDRSLSVWTLDYERVMTDLDYHVRHAEIGADFFVKGQPSAIYQGSLTGLLPEYGLPVTDDEVQFLRAHGYVPLDNTPKPFGVPCIWRKSDTLTYAFTVPLKRVIGQNSFPMQAVMPITSFQQAPDRLRLIVHGLPDEQTVVVAQEVAYPGWTARIDGVAAPLQPVGEFIGAVIEPGTGEHVVEFAYQPPLLFIGGLMTLATALISMLSLARAEPWIRRRKDQRE